MGGMGGGGSSMMASSFGDGGGGQFHSSVMCFSSSMGPDGKMHTEKYAESSAQRGHLKERQQAYSNSHTGMDKMALERHIADRGRKMVRERDNRSGEERQTQLFRGMSEDQAGAFDRDWHSQARGLTH